MWVSQSSLDRIRELELALRESVPQGVHKDALARIAELERRVDWQSDVILLKAGRQPLPPVQPEGPQPEPPPPPPSETAIAQAEAIIEAGRAMGKGREEIEKAVTLQTGLTGADLAAVMSGRGM